MITLKTLPEATAQEVYNQVKAHLLDQNQPSSDSSMCLYRGPNGLKCGAGILISDEEYKDIMEYKDWDTLVIRELVPRDHKDLITSLQHVHDENSVESWEKELAQVAVDYNLEP